MAEESPQSLEIYLSTRHDPYSNLALEHYIYQHRGNNNFALLLYVNTPSVIIGRAQNPWQEVNMGAAVANSIPVARRQSGGGTVYHDLGNLNFCFFAPLAHHDVKQNLACVIDALASLSIPCYQSSKRHQIMFNHHQKEYKISGSAFRQNKDRAFHHGTLLIDTNLKKLETYCTPIPTFATAIKTKAIASIRSKVTCLKQHYPSLSISAVKEAIIAAYQKQHQNLHCQILEVNGHHDCSEVAAYYAHLKSWQWQFGHQMPFHYDYRDPCTQEPALDIEIQKGRITAINALIPAYQGRCLKKLLQRRFFPLDKKGNFVDILESATEREKT